MALPIVKSAVVAASLALDHWDKVGALVDKMGARGKELEQLRGELAKGREETTRLGLELARARSVLRVQIWVVLVSVAASLASSVATIWLLMHGR